MVVAGSALSIAFELAAGRTDEAAFSAMLLTFPAVGFLVLSRRPTERLGWLMVAMGIAGAVMGPFGAYGAYAIEQDRPFGPLGLAIADPGWVPFIGISGYLLLLFPDGHLPSPRWRWFSWLCGIGLALVMVGIWFKPGPFVDSGYPEVENPLGIEALAGPLDLLGALVLIAPALVLGGAVALVVRLRRTTDQVVRHQIRWLAYSASWIAAIFVLAFIPSLGNDSGWSGWIQQVGALSFVLIPITIGLAVLRYRLYDIDVVIRKTVVFAIMTAAIALVYVGLVVGVGAFVGFDGQPHPLRPRGGRRGPGLPAGTRQSETIR